MFHEAIQKHKSGTFFIDHGVQFERAVSTANAKKNYYHYYFLLPAFGE